MKITLLGNPISTQTIYGQTGYRRYMTTRGKKQKERYIMQVQQQYRGEPLEGDLYLEVHLYFGTKRRADRDNFHKLSMDSMEGIVFLDDSQIQYATVKKHYDKENPRIELIIGPFSEIDN